MQIDSIFVGDIAVLVDTDTYKVVKKNAYLKLKIKFCEKYLIDVENNDKYPCSAFALVPGMLFVVPESIVCLEDHLYQYNEILKKNSISKRKLLTLCKNHSNR